MSLFSGTSSVNIGTGILTNTTSNGNIPNNGFLFGGSTSSTNPTSGTGLTSTINPSGGSLFGGGLGTTNNANSNTAGGSLFGGVPVSTTSTNPTSGSLFSVRSEYCKTKY